jgi:hypothetical protein
MSGPGDTAGAVRALLAGLPGVVRAEALEPVQRDHACAEEERYERAAAIPVRNLGMRLLRDRSLCFVVLKDARFRPPRQPTVFLVEEGAAEGSAHALVVEGMRFTVVGEEVVEGHPSSAEATIPLDESFVIFPDRRSAAQVPCSFILPPIGFAELEAASERLGIRRIISISPSLAADMYLRETLGFPRTNALATLLIGCDPAGQP